MGKLTERYIMMIIHRKDAKSDGVLLTDSLSSLHLCGEKKIYFRD